MRNTTIEEFVKRKLEEGFERVKNVDTEKGGIYVETTDDPRGWMLGDKTRKIYKVPDLYIKALTGLLVVALPANNEGSEIRVLVYNHQDTARMLLSKNDDVGSSIEYARIEPMKPSELNAKMGQHICVESLMRGSWIRLLVFPGSGIFEMINNGWEEMKKFLDFYGKVTKEKIDSIADLVDKYVEIEKEINDRLSKLGRYGMSCNCDEPAIFKQIFQGKFDEITETCTQCGGTIEI
jgi:hypothetical protein